MNIFTKTIMAALTSLLFLAFSSLNAQAQSGNVLDFDGVNDYVQIPFNSSISTSTISIELWAKVNSNGGKYQSLITSGGNSAGYSGFAIYAYPDGKWYLFVSNGGPSIIPIVGSSINYGTWTHIAATYYQDTVRFYINSTLVNTLAISNLVPNSSFVTRIGAGNSGGTPTDFFGGEIDDLSFSRDPLTPSKIAYDMSNAITTRSGAIVLSYYNFNEGIANGDNTTPPVNTLIDQSAYHANGTLFNFALNGNTSNWVSLSALPVNLFNFTGTKKDGANLLAWSTASEQNSSRFEVQRGENGTDFSTVGTVAAAGNSDKVINYQYEDRPLSNASIYYYRLKMVDKDGSTKYSNVVIIKNSTSALSTVFPNPARDRITININDNSLLNSKAVITDLNGKVLQSITLTQTATPVNISQYMRGMYVVKFVDGSSVKVVKE
jgi:hypothetical protein